MKKLLGIMVLSLLMGGNVYAEKIEIPLVVNIFQMNKPNGWTTITSEADIINDFKKANEIWSKADVYFDIKEIKFLKNDAKILDSKSYDKFYKELNKKKTRNQVVKFMNKNWQKREKMIDSLISHNKNRTKKVINIYYLPRLFSASCGFTNIKSFSNYKPYVTIPHQRNDFMKKINLVCRDRGATLAHEFGHLLGLKHPKMPTKDKSVKEANVMEYGETISNSDIVIIKKHYKKYYSK